MADSRFYESLGPLRLADVASAVGGTLVRPDDGSVSVAGVEPLERTRPGALSFVFDSALPDIAGLAEGCVLLVRESHVEALAGTGVHAIICGDPRRAFAAIAGRLVAEISLFSHTPIDPGASVGAGCRIAPTACVGAGANIGDNVEIGPGSVIGPGVVIGNDSRIEANCSIRCAEIGARAAIQSGARIGEFGFSIAIGSGMPRALPHFGRVILGDDVLVGANSSIDRGLFGDTTIGSHCKFDNLVHIAHNVTIGEGSVFAGFSAVSGSCVIGRNVLFGGRGGLADHVTVGDGAIIGANSATMKDVPAGEFWFGSPAMPKREYVRERMAIKRLMDRKRPKRDGD